MGSKQEKGQEILRGREGGRREQEKKHRQTRRHVYKTKNEETKMTMAGRMSGLVYLFKQLII